LVDGDPGLDQAASQCESDDPHRPRRADVQEEESSRGTLPLDLFGTHKCASQVGIVPPTLSSIAYLSFILKS